MTDSSSATWEALKAEGNTLFGSDEFLKAAAKYTAAIKAFDGANDDQLAILYSNRCAALTRLNKLSKAVIDADQCLQLRPAWEKGYFRKGAALEQMKEYERALQVYKDAAVACPDTAEFRSKVQRLGPLVKKLSRQKK